MRKKSNNVVPNSVTRIMLSTPTYEGETNSFSGDWKSTDDYNEEVKILQSASYKGLQTIAKEYGLPTYMKKHEIISLIVLQRAGRTVEVELARQELKRSRAQRRDTLEPRPQRKCSYASSSAGSTEEELPRQSASYQPPGGSGGSGKRRKAQPKRSRAARKEHPGPRPPGPPAPPGHSKKSKAAQFSSAAWNERAGQTVIVEPVDAAWQSRCWGSSDAVQPPGSREHASDLNNEGMGSIFAQHGPAGYGPSYWNPGNCASVRSYDCPISSSLSLDSSGWKSDAHNTPGINAQPKHSDNTSASASTFSYRSDVVRSKPLPPQPTGGWRAASQEQVWMRPSASHPHPPPASCHSLCVPRVGNPRPGPGPGPRVCRSSVEDESMPAPADRYPREGGKWMQRHTSGPRSPPFSRQQSSVVARRSLLMKRTESQQPLDTTLSLPSFLGADQKLSYPLILEYLTSSETQVPQQAFPAGSSTAELVTRPRGGSISLDTKGLAFTHSYGNSFDPLYRHDQSCSFSNVAPQVSTFDSLCSSSIPQISRKSSSWNVSIASNNMTSSLCGSVPDSVLVEPAVHASPTSFSRFESAGGSCYLNPSRTNTLPSNCRRPHGYGESLPRASGSATEILTTPFPHPLELDRQVGKTQYAQRWTESWDISRTIVSNGPVIRSHFNTPAAVNELSCYPMPGDTLASSVQSILPKSAVMDNSVLQTPRSMNTLPAHPMPSVFPACSQKPSTTSAEYLQQPDYPYFCTGTEFIPEYSQPNNPQECTQYRISDYSQSDSSSSLSELSQAENSLQTIQPSITLHYYPDYIQPDAVDQPYEDLNLDSLDCSQLKSVHPVDLSQYLELAQSVDPKTESTFPVPSEPAQWNSWSVAVVPETPSIPGPSQPAQWAAGNSAPTTAPSPVPSQPVQWGEECSYNADGIANPLTISSQPAQWTSWPNAAGSAPTSVAFPVVPQPELPEDRSNSATSDSFPVASQPALCDVPSAPPADFLPVASDPAPCEVWSNPTMSAFVPEVSQPAMWEEFSDTETCSVSSAAVCSPVPTQSANSSADSSCEEGQKRPDQCSPIDIHAEPVDAAPDPAIRDHDYVTSPEISLQSIQPEENLENCVQLDPVLSKDETEDVSPASHHNSNALEPSTTFQEPSSNTLRSPKWNLGLNLTNGSPLSLPIQCDVPEAQHVVEIHSEVEAVTASSEAQTACIAVEKAFSYGENCTSISINEIADGSAEPASSLHPVAKEAMGAAQVSDVRPTRPSNEEGCSRTRREAARCRQGRRGMTVEEGPLCDRVDPATGKAMGALLSSCEETHSLSSENHCPGTEVVAEEKEEEIDPVVEETMEATPMCEQASEDDRGRTQEEASCSQDRTDPAAGEAMKPVLSFEKSLTPKGVCGPTKEVVEASRSWIPNHIGEGRDEGDARCTNDPLMKAGIPVNDKNEDGSIAPPCKRPRLDDGSSCSRGSSLRSFEMVNISSGEDEALISRPEERDPLHLSRSGSIDTATSCSLDGDGEAPGRKQAGSGRTRRSKKKDACLEESPRADVAAAMPAGAPLRRNPRRSTRSSLKPMEIQRSDPPTPRPERALVECDNKKSGCRAIVPAAELSAHKLQCCYNLLSCPRSPCQWRGISSRLYTHMIKEHNSSIKTADVESKCTVNIREVHTEKFVFFLREVFQTLFIIGVYSNKPNIFATIQHISPTNSTPSHAMVGTMEVLLNEEDSHFLWQGEVFPFNNNPPHFQNLDHCLHIILPKMKKQTFNINVRVQPTNTKWKIKHDVSSSAS